MSEMSLLFAGVSSIMTFFMILKHPLSLVLILIILTITVILLTLNVFNMSWMSMILFLVFLGGLLVIFTYLSALVPNEMYFFNLQWMLMFMSPFITMVFLEKNSGPNQKTPIAEIISLNDSSSIYMFLLYLLATLMVTMLTAQQLKSPLNQTNY